MTARKGVAETNGRAASSGDVATKWQGGRFLLAIRVIAANPRGGIAHPVKELRRSGSGRRVAQDLPK